jgi:hypothetical protein
MQVDDIQKINDGEWRETANKKGVRVSMLQQKDSKVICPNERTFLSNMVAVVSYHSRHLLFFFVPAVTITFNYQHQRQHPLTATSPLLFPASRAIPTIIATLRAHSISHPPTIWPADPTNSSTTSVMHKSNFHSCTVCPASLTVPSDPPTTHIQIICDQLHIQLELS